MFRGLILSHDLQGLFPSLIPEGKLQVEEMEKAMKSGSYEGLIWMRWSELKTTVISTAFHLSQTAG